MLQFPSGHYCCWHFLVYLLAYTEHFPRVTSGSAWFNIFTLIFAVLVFACLIFLKATMLLCLNLPIWVLLVSISLRLWDKLWGRFDLATNGAYFSSWKAVPVCVITLWMCLSLYEYLDRASSAGKLPVHKSLKCAVHLRILKLWKFELEAIVCTI